MLNKRNTVSMVSASLFMGAMCIPIVGMMPNGDNVDGESVFYRTEYTSRFERVLVESEKVEVSSDTNMNEDSLHKKLDDNQRISIEEPLKVDTEEQNTTAQASEVDKAEPEANAPVEFVSSNAEFIPLDVTEEQEQKPKVEPKTTTPPPKNNGWTEVKIEATFYSDDPSENGGYAGKNALGGKLKVGSLSVPKDIPLGTEFVIEGLPSDVGTSKFKADDRGGAIKMKGDTMRVDVFVARRSGETKQQYLARVNDLGRVTTTGRYKKQ